MFSRKKQPVRGYYEGGQAIGDKHRKGLSCSLKDRQHGRTESEQLGRVGQIWQLGEESS